MILAGDVGGTKVALALFEDVALRKKIKIQNFLSKEFGDFEDIVEAFLPKNLKIDCACFGIAGPIQENTCHATNLPWRIDAKEIEKRFQISTVHLINDLEANAWGVFSLKEEEFYVLNPGVAKLGNRALISAGTGLGEAAFYFDGKKYFPFATEGGHAGFSPNNEEEIELWQYLKQLFEHVSFERFLSGHGIGHIYRFFVDHRKEKELEEVKERMKTEDPAQVISENALKKKCPICIKSLDRFVSIYGGEAGNLALKFLALGGVYVGGGIAPKILEVLKNGIFMSSFVEKGRFKSLLSEIPVKVILNPETALLGAADFAKHSSSSTSGRNI
jgi:glucokinase